MSNPHVDYENKIIILGPWALLPPKRPLFPPGSARWSWGHPRYYKDVTMNMPKNSTVDEYEGFCRHTFPLNNTEAMIVTPKTPRADGRWIWKAFYFNAFPTFELAMLEQGYTLVHVAAHEIFPSRAVMANWDRFYSLLTGDLGFNRRGALFGLSRGAYYLYTWARENPDKVAAIYADNGMCDILSVYKGGGLSDGMQDKWETLIKVMGFGSEAAALSAVSVGPVDDLEPLAAAGIPILHVAATEDQVVPFEENTAVVEKRYRALGGTIQVISHPGLHHPHGLEDPTPIINFMDKNWME